MKNLLFLLITSVMLITASIDSAFSQNISVSYTNAGNVQVKKTTGTTVTTIVDVIPNLSTYCDTQQVVGNSYAIVRFRTANNILDTMHYSPTRDSMNGLTAFEFCNYMNLKYMINRPAGQFWRIPSSTRTQLPGTSFIPQIIQVEDTDSAKIMNRSPAGVWKSILLN